MRVDGQPGWILHARPYRETSVIAECFTRDHGRLGLVARGVRRERPRFPRALLQPLAPLELGWTGHGELATLTAIDAAGQPLAPDGDARLCMLYVNELVLRLTPRLDALPELYDAYADTLRRLVANRAHAWTLRRFERDLLGETGYGVVADALADSGEPLDPDGEYGYVPEHGVVAWNGQHGMLCLRGSALAALADDVEPDARDLAALKHLMRALIRHQLGGGSLRSWGLAGGARS
ncbi:MAG TPA: DNA repair protein RecO, partial [Tahibacter sp.]|nr:DNA repair protein RecO [Tahibacter sp.]